LGIFANFEQIHLDVLGEVILVKVSGELLKLVMGVAQVNDGFGVSELEFQQNVLDLDRIVAFLLVFDDLFNSAQLTDFCGSLDVLLMNLFVVGAVDDCAQEEENTLKGSH
jgi:hypothetical protein